MPRFQGIPVEQPAAPRFQGVPADTAPETGQAPQSVQFMPNMTGVPLVGPLLGMAGYDGRPVGDEASFIPALDPINAAGTKLAESVPVVGPTLANAGRNVDAAFASMVEGKPVSPEERAAIDAGDQTRFPVASGAGQAAGTVLPLAALGSTQLGGDLLGMTGSLGQRVLMGGGSGIVLSGADALARGASPEEARNAALLGGAVGAAFPIVAKGVGMLGDAARGKPTQAVAGGVDDAASREMKSLAGSLFDNSKASGITVQPTSYAKFADDLAAKMSDGLDSTLHPDTVAALRNILGRKGQPLTFTDLHTIRQIAQDASLSPVARDGARAGAIVDAIDEYVASLKPSDMAGAADPSKAAGALHDAINLWSRASKTATIENALYKAQNQASGLENGIRTQFRNLLNNPRTRRLFSKDELMLIEGVVRGSPGANVARLIGKFGFGNGNASNALGGAIGFGAGSMTPLGPLGGILATLGTSGARKASEAMTTSAANRVLNSVAEGAVAPQQGIGKMGLDALMRINQAPVNTPFAPAGLSVLLEQR